jgi:RNA polymerase sigma-70 factor (ECF subfamily)
MSSEQTLIKAAQRGEKEAFETLYDQHYLAVYKYIFYRVGQRPLAEDLTSDVFERMVAKIDTFRIGDKPLIAWLYTIAGNLIKNQVKRQQLLTWLPLDERQADSEDGVGTQVADKLTHEKLRSALSHLTEEQQQVIVLRFMQDQPTRDVAQLVGKPESSIKALQRRAINALRRQFEQEGAHV